jgi:hypothetical protein
MYLTPIHPTKRHPLMLPQHPVRLVAFFMFGILPLSPDVLGTVSSELPIDLGSRLELFVDDYLIDRMEGAQLKLHPPVRAETVLKFDRQWEGSSSGYFTVIEDNGLYRLYYRGSAPNPDNKDVHTASSPMTVCYAESRDGVNWTRPNLHLVEFGGSNENNILLMGQDALSFTPFLDTNPDAPAQERYKAVTGTKVPNVKGYALVGYTSPDGIHWTKIGNHSIIPDTTVNAFDSQNIVFWDDSRKKYLAFYRVMKGGVRWSKFAESADFAHWPKESIQWFDYGDAPMEQLYTAAARPYERAPHIYVGFPDRYVPHRTSPEQPDKVNFGVNDSVFMSSRDGRRWNRGFLESFLRPGRDPLNWTDRNNYVANGLIQTAPDELSLYYTQNFRSPSAHLRRGVMRLDGMVSVNAGYRGGEFVTKPFLYKGDTLVLNFETSAVGSIRLELQDARGNPIPGYELEDFPPLWGDKIDHPVVWKANPTWGTSLKKLEGIPVRLRVVLRDADLYSMQFSSKPRKKN